MGLAAGQARLLSITSRKSDCEYQSMRLSHQKIALARELADLSNEYQNSLNQTKLIYDYYGTGDTSTQLSYNLLMYPSALNDYMPTLITDSMGRVALDTRYAAAARAAGIPQEGLGTLPSEDMRNKFIQGLSDNGLITEKTATTIQGLPYNQAAGFGGGTTVAIQTKDVNLQEFGELLDSYGGINPTDSSYNKEYTRGLTLYNITSTGGTYIADSEGEHFGNYEKATAEQVSLGDILNGNYVLVGYGMDEYNSALGYAGGVIDAVCNSSVWNAMFDAVEDLLDTGDAYTQKALDYARSKIEYMTTNMCDQSKGPGSKGCEDPKRQYNNDTDLENFAHRAGGSDQEKDHKVANQALNYANSDGDGYIGLCLRFNCGRGHDDDSDISAVSINLSSMLKAYLTYFADYMNGISKTDRYGAQVYDVNNKLGESHLVNNLTTFTVKVGSEVSSDDCALATFYDTMFNQICANGWTENDKVNDNEYLQQMLQNGMMFVSKIKDDNYYYQANYATDTYIKEVSDETSIAYAESKYNTEKAKLNAKEETIDLKMKNLDTEISSLTTEYDTVKNTISKNIEKSFKRYNA